MIKPEISKSVSRDDLQKLLDNNKEMRLLLKDVNAFIDTFRPVINGGGISPLNISLIISKAKKIAEQDSSLELFSKLQKYR